MHILILPSWYFSAGSAEISGRMFHQLGSALQSEGIDARILYAELNLRAPLLKKVRFEKEDQVPTWRIYQWFLPKLTSFLIRSWIKKYVHELLLYIQKEGRPDLIHAQSYMAGMVCASLKRKTGIPFILTERLSNFTNGSIPSLYLPFIEDAFEEALHITCVSPGLGGALKQYTEKPIEVIPNFYDPEIFYYDPAIRKHDIFTWVSIGEPAYVKGLDILLKAFSQLRTQFPEINSRLVIIDRIGEKNNLLKLIPSEDISNRITWTGLISQQAIADILRRSHVLISASRNETFGKAIMEAQACGLPVIATRTMGASYLLTSGIQGKLTDIDDSGGLTLAMANVYVQFATYSPIDISDMMKARFSRQLIIEHWKNIYSNIAR